MSDLVGFAEQLSWALYGLDRREYGEELSGDAFLHTRAAVVAGREEYGGTSVPEGFKPYAEEVVWAEALLHVPDRAYEQLTGEEWTRDTRYSYESYSNTAGCSGGQPPQGGPRGVGPVPSRGATRRQHRSSEPPFG